MKKSIATLALMVSASTAMAVPVMRPPNAPQPKLVTSCANIYGQEKDGSVVIGSCDESENNTDLHKRILKNGCAEDQVAIQTYDTKALNSCMPAGAVQL